MPDGTFKDDEALKSKEEESLFDGGAMPQVLVIPSGGGARRKPPSFKDQMWHLVLSLAFLIAVLSVAALVVSTAWNTTAATTALPEIDWQTAFCFAVIWRVLSFTWRM